MTRIDVLAAIKLIPIVNRAFLNKEPQPLSLVGIRYDSMELAWKDSRGDYIESHLIRIYFRITSTVYMEWFDHMLEATKGK